MKNNQNLASVEAVLLDGMYTLIEPKGSRAELLAALFSEETGRRVSATKLWRITEQVRKEMAVASGGPIDWRLANRLIFERYGLQPLGDMDKACERMHRRVLYDFRLYEIKPDMRQLVQKLASLPLALGIDSNQDQAGLEIMLEQMRVRRYFKSQYIFSSQRLRDIPKPRLKHFRMIFESLGRAPSSIVLIGNNLRNDAPAARLGERVIIFSRDNDLHQQMGESHELFSAANRGRLFICTNTKEVFTLIKGWL